MTAQRARTAAALLAGWVATAAAPPTVHAAGLSVDPPVIVLGRTESAQVTIEAEEAPGSEELPLRLSVNVGTVGAVTRVGRGRYQAVYVPPATRFPQVALFGVWRETGPEAPIAFLRIPLYGTTRLHAIARRGSRVTVEVGGATFGPFVANARGRAIAPIVVPPGVRKARMTAKGRRGVVTQRELKVEVPPYNRLTAALVPHAVVADGKSWARIEVFYDLGGPDVPATRIKVEPSIGTAVLQQAAGRRYVYRYVPPAGARARQVTFDVSVRGDRAAGATATLALGLPDPARIVVRAPADRVVVGGPSDVPIEVLVLDAEGLGLPGQPLEVSANDSPLAPATDAGNGRYVAMLTPPAHYPEGGLIQVVAAIPSRHGEKTTGTRILQLAAPPTPVGLAATISPDPVPADGETRADVVFEVSDEAGRPLDQAQLIAVADRGVLGPLRGEGQGIYRATYTAPMGAGERPATLRIIDAAGAFEATVPVRLRAPVRRRFVGVQAGFTHSLRHLSGPRLGLDAWASVGLIGRTFGLGLAASYAWATQRVSDGTVTSTTRARFVPISLRVGAELLVAGPVAVYAGAGGVVTIAYVETSVGGVAATHVGGGALGFGALWVELGPGHAFVDVAYTWAPVAATDTRLSAGGLGFVAGYRYGFF